MRFTRGRVRELKNARNSVTVQNRTHVYVNFFDHKNLGNHLLQLCPKVVKHPVLYIYKKMQGMNNIKFVIIEGICETSRNYLKSCSVKHFILFPFQDFALQAHLNIQKF